MDEISEPEGSLSAEISHDNAINAFASCGRLDRDFQASEPNQKWVTDITSLPCPDGWLSLATVMDLYSQKIVGWAMQNRLETLLVVEALQMALNRRQPGAGLLHHSDRGRQYASGAYRQAWQRLEAVQSMSRKGECWDSSVQERFFATLKTELELSQARKNRAQTRLEVFEWT